MVQEYNEDWENEKGKVESETNLQTFFSWGEDQIRANKSMYFNTKNNFFKASDYEDKKKWM